MDEKMLEKHIVNHHLKKKCCFCAEKLLKKEVEEHMDTVHKKIPVKSVEYKIGPKGKTDVKTTMEWGDRDEKLVDSTKKKKVDYSYKRVDNKENFKNIDIDAMEESDEDYIPSSEEEDVVLTPPPREKSIRKRQYPFNCKVCDEKFLSKVFFQVHEKLAHLANAPSPSKHVCPQCLKKFTSSFNMSRHLEKQHEAGSREDHAQPAKKMRMECDSCTSTFASKFNLRRHMDKIH